MSDRERERVTDAEQMQTPLKWFSTRPQKKSNENTKERKKKITEELV